MLTEYVFQDVFGDAQAVYVPGRGHRILVPEDGFMFTLHYDQVGSLRVVADESGNVIKEVLYDPFGGIIEDTNPDLRIPIGYAGGLHDRDLGFVRFGWRDYDTFTSRWTSPDPIGDAGGDPDWYGYCLDDPVNLIDPKGLAYAGNDFGPGYDGTSGSAYGPTSGGWGYNSDPGGSHDTGNNNSQSNNQRTEKPTQNPGNNTLAAKRSLVERERRNKTNQQKSQEMERLAEEKAEKERQARAYQDRRDRQRRAAGRNIVGRALKDGAKWGGIGAGVGSFAPGFGTLGGFLTGGMAGFTSGLLKGTIDDSIDNSDLSDLTKDSWDVVDSLW